MLKRLRGDAGKVGIINMFGILLVVAAVIAGLYAHKNGLGPFPPVGK